MRLALLAAALLVATAAQAQDRVFVDAGGREVTIPATVTTVLTAGPPAEILVYTLAPETLAGWVREPSEAALEFIPDPYRDLPTYGRLTGQGGTANMEAVLAAQPDLIIDAGTVNDTYISLADQVQEQTGIPYILVDGGFGNTAETYRALGELLGVEERAEVLAAYAEDTLASIEAAVAEAPAEARPRVYYGRGPDGLETGLSTSINLELLGYAGAENVAAAAGPGGLTNVSLEQILDWNPEVIIAAQPGFAELAATDPLWADIDAVAAGEVYTAPALPFGWFDTPPGVNRLIGVRWLQNLFYPDSVEEPLEDQIKTFFDLFYHIELNDDQVADLLAGAL